MRETFTTHAGVQPTNNPAERALRSPVIHRKLSHGTRADDALVPGRSRYPVFETGANGPYRP